MPPPETSGRYQTAVLWSADGTDPYGQPKTSSPVEVKVRWEQTRKEVVGANGSPMALDAEAVVDRKIPIGSQMWLGTLAEWYGSGSAGSDTEVMEVKTYEEAPDVKGRASMRVVGLMRFKNERAEA